jgi:triacylglycerol lipase
VNVKIGAYGSIRDTTFNHDIFLGIPFAQLPAGNLGICVPEPVNETWTGTRQGVAWPWEELPCVDS